MADKTVRNLLHLQANASTSRALSLYNVWRRHAHEPDYKSKPFFHSVPLNRSIIVKHRLREGERDVIAGDRRSVTKVILPIDLMDLKLGARSFFVGQKGYQAFMDELAQAGPGTGGRDEHLLSLLDSLPSLDPFLMRESLNKAGVEPARCYFELSNADMERMFKFVQREVSPLVGMSFDDKNPKGNEKSEKLARKLLENAGDEALDPLRQGMGMQRAEFEEGVFCWKGFIYYKWTLSDLLPKVRPVANGIGRVKPIGPTNEDERAYIEGARQRLTRAIAQACTNVRSTLKIYDDAYWDMTKHGNPAAFREFLRNAPDLFYALGDRLGSINHIVSFWGFRFPSGAKAKISTDELIDLFVDFECGISSESASGDAKRPVGPGALLAQTADRSRDQDFTILAASKS